MIIKFTKIVRFFSMSKIFVCNISISECNSYFSKFAIVIVLEYFGKNFQNKFISLDHLVDIRFIMYIIIPIGVNFILSHFTEKSGNTWIVG